MTTDGTTDPQLGIFLNVDVAFDRAAKIVSIAGERRINRLQTFPREP